MKVAVLGGLGAMAEAALNELARRPSFSSVVAADLSAGRKRVVLSELPASLRRKVRVVALDLRDTRRCAKILRGTGIVLNAAWYEHNLKAMDLALALGAHYADLGGLYHMTLRQLKRSREFERRGLLGVLGCGSAPGVTNMMAAAMARSFESIRGVGIYNASHDPDLSREAFLPPFSIRTLLDECVMPAPVLQNGRIRPVPAHSLPEPLEFPAPIGPVTAYAIIHSEAATLPAYLRGRGIRDLAFKIAYPERMKAQLDLLVGMGLGREEPVSLDGRLRVSPRSFLAAAALKNAARPRRPPRDFEVLRVRLRGRRGGAALSMEWDCELRPVGGLSAGAVGVGFAASIACGMIAEGRLLRPAGVFPPESCLDPAAFFQALRSSKGFRLIERAERAVSGLHETDECAHCGRRP